MSADVFILSPSLSLCDSLSHSISLSLFLSASSYFLLFLSFFLCLYLPLSLCFLASQQIKFNGRVTSNKSLILPESFFSCLMSKGVRQDVFSVLLTAPPTPHLARILGSCSSPPLVSCFQFFFLKANKIFFNFGKRQFVPVSKCDPIRSIKYKRE